MGEMRQGEAEGQLIASIRRRHRHMFVEYQESRRSFESLIGELKPTLQEHLASAAEKARSEGKRDGRWGKGYKAGLEEAAEIVDSFHDISDRRHFKAFGEKNSPCQCREISDAIRSPEQA